MVDEQAQPARVGERLGFRQFDIAAEPDLRAVPDGADLGAGCPTSAKAARAHLPVAVVKLTHGPARGGALGRIAPIAPVVAGRGDHGRDIA